MITVEKYSLEEIWEMVRAGEVKDAKTLAILSLARDWFAT